MAKKKKGIDATLQNLAEAQNTSLDVPVSKDTGEGDKGIKRPNMGRPSHLKDEFGNVAPFKQFTVRIKIEAHKDLVNAVNDGHARTKSELIELAIIQYLKDKK